MIVVSVLLQRTRGIQHTMSRLDENGRKKKCSIAIAVKSSAAVERIRNVLFRRGTRSKQRSEAPKLTYCRSAYFMDLSLKIALMFPFLFLQSHVTYSLYGRQVVSIFLCNFESWLVKWWTIYGERWWSEINEPQYTFTIFGVCVFARQRPVTSRFPFFPVPDKFGLYP